MTSKTTKRHYSFRLYDFYENRSPQLQLLINTQRVATDSMVGNDLPNFRNVISQGRSAVNLLSATRQRIVYRKGLVTTHLKDNATTKAWEGWTEAISPIPYVNTRNVSQSLVDEADSLAKVAVIKKIKSQLGFNGPVILGELKETIGWIKSPARSLRAAFYGFFDKQNRKLFDLDRSMKSAVNKRHRRKLFDRYTKDLADDYMELTFAVRPLIGTIKDIADAALRKFETNKLQRLSASVPRESASYDSSIGFHHTGNLQYLHKYQILKKDQVLVQYVAWCKENIPNTESVLRRVYESSNMNLGEIPGVIWELFPLSWMYDYFTNIGDLLACNFDYNAQVAFAKKSVTKDVIDIAVDFQSKRVVSKFWVNSSYEPPYMLSHSRTFSRTPLTDLGNVSPRLSFSLPGSTDQFLNMAGLARQRFDSCFNKWRSVKI